MDITQPIIVPISSSSDVETEQFAAYLYQNLNRIFYNANKGDIVKTYRTFNDISIPLIDFPCLRVFKTNNIPYADYSYSNIFQYTVNYIIAFTSRQKTSDISAYVGREILRLLINSNFEDSFPLQLDFSFEPNVEYDTLISPNNTVYKYTNVTFRAYSALTNAYT